mmetsp:Transcript_232/g.346  ORF Transcript_232/g.346 Transcript_232/m.346 type:complete len:105 (-) Transcript_232:231-545(-)
MDQIMQQPSYESNVHKHMMTSQQDEIMKEDWMIKSEDDAKHTLRQAPRSFLSCKRSKVSPNTLPPLSVKSSERGAFKFIQRINPNSHKKKPFASLNLNFDLPPF